MSLRRFANAPLVAASLVLLAVAFPTIQAQDAQTLATFRGGVDSSPTIEGEPLTLYRTGRPGFDQDQHQNCEKPGPHHPLLSGLQNPVSPPSRAAGQTFRINSRASLLHG